MTEFSRLWSWEIGTKFNSEAVNDTLVVHGFSVGYKAVRILPIASVASFCAAIVISIIHKAKGGEKHRLI